MTHDAATAWRRRRFFAALAVCLCWLAFLIEQVVYTANPPLVSRPQVLSASAVVEATVDLRGETPRLKVTRILWSRRALTLKDFPPDGVPASLPPSPWRRQDALVYAAVEERIGGRFGVQPIPFDFGPPANVDPAPIYPVAPIVERQLEELRPAGRGEGGK